MSQKSKRAMGKIVTPFFRVSYPNVFRAKRNDLNGQDEYSMVMLFDKKDQKELKAMKELATKIAKEQWGDKIPAKFRSPFRDGDAEKPDNPSFKGMIFMTAKSKYQPGLVNGRNETIISEDEFYGGCYARAEVNLFAYEVKGNSGISVGLNHIQKQKDGTPFGNRTSAEDAFAPVEGEESGDFAADIGGEKSSTANLFG